MWWEELLVFAVVAIAGGFSLSRLWRGLRGSDGCCNCGKAHCASRGVAPISPTAPASASAPTVAPGAQKRVPGHAA